MDDIDDSVNRTDFKNQSILLELKEYTSKITPEHVQVFDDLLSGKDVKISTIQKAMEPLLAATFQHLNSDGSFNDEKNARLDELLAQLGGQL